MLIRNHTQDQTDAVNQSVVNYYIVCNETCQPNPFNNVRRERGRERGRESHDVITPLYGEYLFLHYLLQLINDANVAFTTIRGLEEELQNYISTNSTSLQVIVTFWFLVEAQGIVECIPTEMYY